MSYIKVLAVRGATTCEVNTKNEILQNTKELVSKIVEINNIDIDDIIAVFMTMTSDLDKVYPAVAVRELGIINAGIMCYDELSIENSLKKCIRVMIQYNGRVQQKDIKHIYLKGAKNLRPDLKNRR